MHERSGVLFVCLGNICRSPMATGVFQRDARAVGLDPVLRVDSAATHPYQIGRQADERARAASARRGIDISAHRARCIEMKDYREFEYVIAMDRDNLQALRYTCPGDRQHVLHLCLDFAPAIDALDVPDPFHGDERDFENVLDMLEIACQGLLRDIRGRLDI